MFAFLTRLRLMSADPPTDDAGDDTSSLNRSLNLPWPVTESAARRPRAGSTATVTPAPTQAMTISYPIPRTTPNSLTGVDEHSTAVAVAPSTLGGTANAAGARPARSVQPQATASRSAQWYAPEKPRRLGSEPPAPTSGAPPASYAPPQVVRLDSEAVAHESSEEEDIAPPRYSTYANTSTEALSLASYAHAGYETAPESIASSIAALPPRPSRPVMPFAEDEGEGDGDFYVSPFDADPVNTSPLPPRASSTSSLPTAVPARPASMPKSRWGLRLQMQGTQSMPVLSRARTEQRPMPGAFEAAPAGTETDMYAQTDVYAHAYSYPLAKQLSPIAEQDYVSPAAESPVRTASLRFAGSTASSLTSAGAALLRNDSAKSGSASGERESVKTRTGSGRSGSGGSAGTASGMGGHSRTGSASVTGSPSEVMRPSPVYSSPFLTRHLNRTVSQSSSKSDTQSQCASAPTPVQAPTPTQHARPYAMAHLLTSVLRAANPVLAKEVVVTPTSADTTGTATGTMYTPTSTLPGSGGGQTPTSPNKVSGPVQPPPPAMTIAPAPEVNEETPKIPALPDIEPLDLRFSRIGLDGDGGSSKAGSALRKGIAGVERMPVIHSDEGHHTLNEEEEDEYDEEDEDEDEEGEEYDIDIEEADDDDDEYDRESLHAESFVTAGTSDAGPHDVEQGVELATFTPRDGGSWRTPTPPSARGAGTPSPRPTSVTSDPGVPEGASAVGSRTGDSFILRRWDAAAALTASPGTSPTAGGPGAPALTPAARWPFRTPSPDRVAILARTPAFWAFWLGFMCPILWLVGGWGLTHAGERPPRASAAAWYLWRPADGIARAAKRALRCCTGARRRSRKEKQVARGSQDSAGSGGSAGADSGVAIPAPGSGTVAQAQRRRGKRRSADAAARAGQVYPALPRWVAEKQRTDDGRMRLNDPKRSLRGISFGYPFVPRPPPTSRPAHESAVWRVLGAPNRALDALYGVRLVEVRGRPESGRRMFDPWIQRCRYAMCYALLLLAVGLCIACAWLIVVNTRRMTAAK